MLMFSFEYKRIFAIFCGSKSEKKRCECGFLGMSDKTMGKFQCCCLCQTGI